MSDKKRKLVAYHEAGHALVGALMPEYDPVTKISIVPRGAAGGLTFFAPSEERLESGLYSRTYFENQVRLRCNIFGLVFAVAGGRDAVV
jgi:cell division protease FtsH